MTVTKITAICILVLLLFTAQIHTTITETDKSSEEKCYNVVWYSFVGNDFILSKNLNEISSPRKWMRISEDNFILSANPEIDSMKLYEVYELLCKRVQENPEKNQKLLRIDIENKSGERFNEEQVEHRKWDTFYLVIRFEDGITLVYNGALARIDVPLGIISLPTSNPSAIGEKSNDQDDSSNISKKIKAIINEKSRPFGILKDIQNVIKELYSFDGEFKDLFSVFEIEIVGEDQGKATRQHLEESLEKYEWYEGSFPHWLKGQNNYFIKERNWNIDHVWDLADNYALYNESARIIREQFEELENYNEFDHYDLNDLFYSKEITEFEEKVNFFQNAVNAMEYWADTIAKNPLINIYDFGTHWTTDRPTIVYLEGVTQNKLSQYRQMQTKRLSYLAILLAFVSILLAFVFSYSRKSFFDGLKLNLAAAFVILLALSFFLFIFYVYSLEFGLLIFAFFGAIATYWRFELDKYNKVARDLLDELAKIFEKDEICRQQRLELGSILMKLATFNKTYAWNRTKWLLNRFLGLDKELEFECKTPRYFEELTEITEAINRDNGIRAIFRFLFTGSLFRDPYYKEWLDTAIELLRVPYDQKQYRICKCEILLKKYINFGSFASKEGRGSLSFDAEVANYKFVDFMKRQEIENIDKHISNILSEETDKIFSDIENHLKNNKYSEEQIEQIMKEIENRFKV